MGQPDDELHPLSDWIRGTLTLHFSGATVQRRTSLSEARSIQEILSEERAGDRLAWSSSGWIQFAEDKVLASEFETDEDLGWGLTVEDRAVLERHGHRHGMLRTLRDHWRREGREPQYTAIALLTLHRLALDGINGSTFERLADMLEGEAGRDVMQRLEDEIDRGDASTPREGRPTPEPDNNGGTGPAGPDGPTNERQASASDHAEPDPVPEHVPEQEHADEPVDHGDGPVDD